MIIFFTLGDMKTSQQKHPFLQRLVTFFLRSIIYIHYHYRAKDKYKIAKGESVVVLANHQTDIDPLLIYLSFNKTLYTVATDNIFRKGLVSSFLKRMGCIPKKKGVVDLKSNIEMMRVVSRGDSLLFFPEGNRSYAEFQYYITPAIGKYLKAFKSTIILFNIHGGTGVFPRFAKKKRKGPFYGQIKKVLKYEDYADIPNEELTQIIKDNLRVIDSESKQLYKSKASAEYLERLFFLCPVCMTPHKLVSKGHYLRCQNCGLEVEYKPDLTLASNHPHFTYTKLLPWYNLQKRWIKDLPIKDDEIIFTDGPVTLKNANPEEERKIIAKGQMSVTNHYLSFPNISFPIEDIMIASPVSGIKLCFTIKDKSYQVIGHKRFNPLKYVFLFNKLNTLMNQKQIDNYFQIQEDDK